VAIALQTLTIQIRAAILTPKEMKGQEWPFMAQVVMRIKIKLSSPCQRSGSANAKTGKLKLKLENGSCFQIQSEMITRLSTKLVHILNSMN
jgi:hypothetical protein